MISNITETLAKFSSELQFDDLPEEVIHETKRIILDTVGIALGSLDLDKGSIAIELARQIGGRPEATILGIGERVPSPIAAFANGELMHSLDYCSLLPPAHIAAYVTPAPLALAEARNASGKTLITAVALAHEIASRIGVSLGPMRAESGLPVRSWGLGCNEFGAAAGAAKIIGLDSGMMADALGLAGYFAPVPSHTKHVYTPDNGMAKYGPAGWTAQGGVTATILAEMGERGDRQVLDGEYGFWAMNGSRDCNWEAITGNLGKEWNILQAKYKCWPCCGIFQSPLGAFTKLINDNDLKPEEMQQVIIKTEALGLLPRFMSHTIDHNVDASMSFPYNVAVVAHRIKVGPAWQARSTIEDPSIQEFMKKVKIEPYPMAEETHHQELEVEGKLYINRRPSCVEVTARGKVFTQEAEYAKWLSTDNAEFRATDEDLAEKFHANAANTLSAKKLETAIATIMNLETIGDTAKLLEVLIR